MIYLGPVRLAYATGALEGVARFRFLNPEPPITREQNRWSPRSTTTFGVAAEASLNLYAPPLRQHLNSLGRRIVSLTTSSTIDRLVGPRAIRAPLRVTRKYILVRRLHIALLDCLFAI